MVLAIALGIAVDDTIHLLVRLREAARRPAATPETAVSQTLQETGRPILYTSIVLVAGFLSMATNDLLAIRDMGLLAAGTLAIALLADLYLAPAVYLTLVRRQPAPAQPREVVPYV